MFTLYRRGEAPVRFIKRLEHVAHNGHRGPYTIYASTEWIDMATNPDRSRFEEIASGPCFLLERDGLWMSFEPFPADGSLPEFMEQHP